MYHRKRFRSSIDIVLTLLLIVALAPAAAAQELPPPPEPPPEPTEPSTIPDPPGPGPTATATPDPGTGTPPPPVTPTATPDNGGMNGGMNGDKDNGMMAPSPHSWPPPNAIVRHAATPVQISALGAGLHVYLVAPGADVTSGPVLPSFSELAEMYPSGDPVSLYSGTNPGSGKPVMIDYLPDAMKIRVSTYYADKPPHDFNKPYVFTVDADHSVSHEGW